MIPAPKGPGGICSYRQSLDQKPRNQGPRLADNPLDMKLEDYLEGLYRLGMAVGDFWFESHDPLAYRLAERLFEVAEDAAGTRAARNEKLNATRRLGPVNVWGYSALPTSAKCARGRVG